jgi:hypothetical protein
MHILTIFSVVLSKSFEVSFQGKEMRRVSHREVKEKEILFYCLLSHIQMSDHDHLTLGRCSTHLQSHTWPALRHCHRPRHQTQDCTDWHSNYRENCKTEINQSSGYKSVFKREVLVDHIRCRKLDVAFRIQPADLAIT